MKKMIWWMDKRVWLPVLCFLNEWTRKRIQRRSVDGDNAPGWKEQALEDFEIWIATLDEGPAEAEDPRTLGRMDLFTLLSEFSALRKEIALQNREQAKNSRALEDFNSFSHEAANVLTAFDEKIKTLDALGEEAGKKAEQRACTNFFDVRDSLRRGLESGRKATGTPAPIFGGKRIRGMVKGYEITLGKIDKAFAMAGVYPVETENARFDPKTMQAVEKRTVKGIESGYVSQEISCGFVTEDRVIKPAEVIVAG